MVFGARNFKEAQRWETEGQIVNGTIEDFWFQANNAQHQHFTLYFVRYRFEAIGKPYFLQQTVSEKEYFSLYKGKVVRIKYLPDKPQIARMMKLRG